MKYAGTKYVFGHDYHHLNTFKRTKMKYLQKRGVFKEEPDRRSPHLPYLECSDVNLVGDITLKYGNVPCKTMFKKGGPAYLKS